MNLGKEKVDSYINYRQAGKQRTGHHAISIVLRALLLFFVILFFVGGGFAYGAWQGIVKEAPNLESVSVAPKGYATVLYDRDGAPMRSLVQAGSNRTEVSFEDLPKNLINAFVAIEDERFFTHNGIDVKGIFRAAFVGISTGHFSEGASTITQQLIKNNVLGGGSESNWSDRIVRKLQEQYLAVQLEKQMSKETILTNYLNTINLGSNTLGVEAAANRYFNKHVSELTLSECAVVASITKNPSAYNPITHSDKNAERRATVLKRMLNQGLINEFQYEEALNDHVYDRIQNANTASSTGKPYTYFEDAVVESVISDLQEELGYTQTQAFNLLYSGGLRIYTTMDSDIQAIVDDEINNTANYPVERYSFTYSLRIEHADGSVSTYNENSIRSYFQNYENAPAFNLVFDTKEEINDLVSQYKSVLIKDGDTVAEESLDITLQPQASMVVLDNSTGQVAAISGGRGDKTASLSLDRATDSTRQPGSCFKVLADFAPALDTRSATLATTYYDAPFSADGKAFANWWGSDYVGYANIRQGIVYSMNIIATKCMVQTVTPGVGYNYLKEFGFTTLEDGRQTSAGFITDVVPALCLGGITNGVTNLEMTAAYATIANGGVYNEPVFYTRIEDRNGRVILENEASTHRVLEESTSVLVTSAMEDTFSTEASPWEEYGVHALGQGLNTGDMNYAAKSGSTTNNHDVWFEGYSPYYTCGIWSGYDESVSFGYGQDFHKTIWANVMRRIHTGLIDTGFRTSPNVVSAQICSLSGKLAVAGVCGEGDDAGYVYTEYFTAGTQPTSYCNRHVKVSVCKDSGLPATEYCPPDSIEEKVYVNIDTADLDENPDVVTDDTKYALPSEFANLTCDLHTEEKTKGETLEEGESQGGKRDNTGSDTSETEEATETEGEKTP